MPENVTSPESPPSGGGIGSQAATGSPASSSPPTPPESQTLAQMAAATTPAATVPPVAVQPAAPATPVVPAAVQTPAAPVVTLESLQAELQAAKASQMPAEELEALRQFALYGKQQWDQQQAAARAGTPAAAAPQQQASAPAGPAIATGVIPFTEADRAWLTSDPATGEVKAIPGAPADILPRFHQNQQTSAKFLREFSQDPAKFLMPLVQAEAKKIAAAEAQQALQQQQSGSTGQNIVAQNKEWIFEKDPKGPNGIKHTVFGQPVYTEAGTLYLQNVEKLYAGGQGITDNNLLNEMAVKLVIGEFTQRRAAQGLPPVAGTPAAAAPTVPPTAAQNDAAQRQALLDRAQQLAAAAPNTAPVNPAAAPTQVSKPMSLFEMAKRDNQAAGSPLKL